MLSKYLMIWLHKWVLFCSFYGFPGGSDSKESTCNAGDPGLISGSRRSPGEGNGNSLQYSCLENSRDRRAWWATVPGVAKKHKLETKTFTFFLQKNFFNVLNFNEIDLEKSVISFSDEGHFDEPLSAFCAYIRIGVWFFVCLFFLMFLGFYPLSN